jgi:hypothetical protein
MNDECLDLEAQTWIGLMFSALEHVWFPLKPMAPLSEQAIRTERYLREFDHYNTFIHFLQLFECIDG